jgi:hypothetical protein
VTPEDATVPIAGVEATADIENHPSDKVKIIVTLMPSFIIFPENSVSKHPYKGNIFDVFMKR